MVDPTIEEAERDFLQTPAPTRLEAFLRRHRKKIKPAQLADEAEYSRQHLLNIRKGLSKASRRCRRDILDAVQAIMKDPSIMMSDLFEAGEDD
jgi:hypothetical protein